MFISANSETNNQILKVIKPILLPIKILNIALLKNLTNFRSIFGNGDLAYKQLVLYETSFPIPFFFTGKKEKTSQRITLNDKNLDYDNTVYCHFLIMPL